MIWLTRALYELTFSVLLAGAFLVCWVGVKEMR
jgi:hypothetical protein